MELSDNRLQLNWLFPKNHFVMIIDVFPLIIQY